MIATFDTEKRRPRVINMGNHGIRQALRRTRLSCYKCCPLYWIGLWLAKHHCTLSPKMNPYQTINPISIMFTKALMPCNFENRLFRFCISFECSPFSQYFFPSFVSWCFLSFITFVVAGPKNSRFVTAVINIPTIGVRILNRLCDSKTPYILPLS